MLIKPNKLTNTLLFILMLFDVSALAYAKSEPFHSPKFNIALNNNLKLISKSEEPSNGFYRYVFASSNSDDAKQQVRVIVSDKQPEKNQSITEFQTEVLGNMSAMLMDSYNLYQYLDTPENKRVLSNKPNQFNLGQNNYAGVTMFFGDMHASFLVTKSRNMTYAFTLISKDPNKQVRTKNLKALTMQLESIKFN